MSAPAEASAKWIRCPVCLDQFPWQENELWIPTSEVGVYEPVDLSEVNDPVKRNDIRRNCYQRCPNPSGDADPHHLPASYLDYGPPVVIGLAGRSGSGKTHLLTAMIAELERGGLSAATGLTVRAMDLLLDRRFRTEHLNRLQNEEELDGTKHGLSGFANVLTLTSPSGTTPVTFFDISGEDFLREGDRGQAARFLIGVDALLFVETPEHALGIRHREPDEGRRVNLAFKRVVSRLEDLGLTGKVPAAIVLNKSDRLRYVPPVDRWIRRADDSSLDAEAMLEESRDVFGFLHQHGADSSLAPFHSFTRCTLHFASATGAEPLNRKFVRGVRPMRVLRPLLALLAMTGVLTEPEARKVGCWDVQAGR